MQSYSTMKVIRERTQGRNLEAGTEVETMEKHWIALYGLVSLFSYITKTYLSRDGTLAIGLGLLFQSLMKEMTNRFEVPLPR